MAPLLEVIGLHVEAGGQPILRGVDLAVEEGEICAVMGPNGSGKSTLAGTITGSPEYKVTAGTIRFRGEDVTGWPPDVRAKAGIFMAFQHPEAIDGVPLVQFLRQAVAARTGQQTSILEVRVALMEWLEKLGMDPALAGRYLNEGFSGGERKRNEILQMALLQPEVAILDETDSGLDIDGIQAVTSGVLAVRSARPRMGMLLVTHYAKFLDNLAPERIHIMVRGEVRRTGGRELADLIEAEGYEQWQQ